MNIGKGYAKIILFGDHFAIRSLMWFEKDINNKKNEIMPFKIGAELILVLCDSKITHNTKEIVANVRSRAKEDSDKFGKILLETKKL